MLHGVITFWTGLLVVLAIGMFGACLVLKLREFGFDLLRELSKVRNRPWFERALLLFFICGMVQYAATKGTGNSGRSSGLETSDNSVEESEMMALRSGNSQEAGEVTNLCFTGISVLTNGVELSIAWPTNFLTEGTILDFFAKHDALTNGWRWFACYQPLPNMTNACVVADWQDDLGCATNHSAMFFKVLDRSTCASTMVDTDGDGLPDIYELHNGTNPYVSDYALAPKLTVGEGGDYGTLMEALSASTDYSIVELSSEAAIFVEMVTSPSHPVLLTGPQDSYARLYSSANIAMFMLNNGQECDTLFRNIYVILTARDNFQSAFWVGGNLPWSGVGASPAFENVRVRALYPNVLHYGWHYYRDDGGISPISNCVMNAAGSTSAIGIYSYDGPNVDISDCAFVNFPTNEGNYASWIKDGTNIVAELPHVDTNLSWAGYSLNGTYSSTIDSDEDGISDYDEIRIHDTDPWLPDSDGDGLTDAEEIEAGTNPKDLYSFYRHVTVVTTTTDNLADTTNYVAWGTSSVGWETNDISSCWALPATNTFIVMSTSGPMYVKSYRDLNRNGQYDPETDIILIRQVPPLDAVSTFILQFGDIDGDGVLDAIERQDGSDPYDKGSFRLRATVSCVNTDTTIGITNYLGRAGCPDSDRVSFITSGAMAVDMLLTNGVCEIICLRDFNSDGEYDADVDVLYSRILTKSDNGKTISIAIGDADSDGQSDSSERFHGTDPIDAKNYCFNLTFVEDGIFSTTNALTAEVFFGTNVIVGPITMTNRTWEVNVGHLIASNRERVVAYFWDDANSNGLRDAEECCARQTFTIKEHDNVLTNTLSFGTFDRDCDEMLDYWELSHADAGLSPTNAADAFLDNDADGLINYHEYWAGYNPAEPDGSNTLISVCSRSVDDRIRNIVPSNAVDRFVNFFENGSNGVFVANTNFWLRDVDVSCVSAWNLSTEDSGSKSATAITRRHVIMAAHWAANTYHFCTTNGIVVTRSIDRTYRMPGSDLLVGRLNSALPDSISLPKVLAANVIDLIKNCEYLPVVCMNNRKAATILELDNLNCDIKAKNGTVYHYMGKTKAANSVSPERVAVWEATDVGNSSSPVFLLIDKELIFLFSKHLGYKEVDASRENWGPVVSYWLNEVQNKINEWEGSNADDYQINVVESFSFE